MTDPIEEAEAYVARLPHSEVPVVNIVRALIAAARADRERLAEAESKLAAVTMEALTDAERVKIAACVRACDSIFKDYAPAEIDGLTASVRAAWRAGQMANEGDE